MYLDDALLYNQGYMISINDLDSPLFYLFDYDSRSFKINMSFQHFHQFHEIHILLSGRASHLIEGDYYTLQPYDIVLLRPSMMHKTEYPAGGDPAAADRQHPAYCGAGCQNRRLLCAGTGVRPHAGHGGKAARPERGRG